MSDRPVQSDTSTSAGGGPPDFARVYEANHAWVFGYLRARLLDSHDAEDLAQEVFLRAYGAMRRYDPHLGMRPWLRGIARNVLREHIRKSQRRRGETAWAELCLEAEKIAGADGMYDDVLAELPTCLAHLGDSAAEALKSHYFGGQKIEDISRHLGRSLGAVKVLMVRARQTLKRCFTQRLNGAGP